MPESQNTKSDDIGLNPKVSGSLAVATFCCHMNLNTHSVTSTHVPKGVCNLAGTEPRTGTSGGADRGR